jgi:hypothetical protein
MTKNTKIKLTLFASLAAVGLSACSGSGISIDDIVSEGDRLFQEADSAELTAIADMPQTGSATFNGVAGFAEDASSEEPDAAARVEFTADFESQTVSGSFYDFTTMAEDMPAVAGTVNIENGTFVDDGGNQGFKADLNGQLTVEDQSATLVGNTEGNFANQATLVVGEAEATLTLDDSGDSTTIFGAYAAD